MLRSIQAPVKKGTSASSTHLLRRGYSSESGPERKVAVLGAAGGIRQPLALLMKLNPLISNPALYNIAGTPCVAADISHINTRSEVMSGEEVSEVSQARFWELVPGLVIGSLSLQVKKGIDDRPILQHVHGFYNDLGVRDLTVQTDYA